MDKILLVYASFGEGHKKAAVCLQDSLNAPCIDLLDFSFPFIKKIYIYGYLFITENLQFVWKFLFSSTKNKAIIKINERLQEFLFFPFFGYLRKTKPKVIICTHFFPLAFIATIKNELGIKIITIVTDTHAHPMWAHMAVDYYFVAFNETKDDLLRAGIKEDKIFSGFASLREGFFEKLDERELRKKFAIDDKPCILCMSSLRGNFPYLEDFIRNFKDNFNIFIIYGKNGKLKKYLEALNVPSVKFFSIYEEIWQIFKLCSVIITKPGGLTIFEGISQKKLFVFTRYIPGQEKENMDLLIARGVGKFAASPQELITTVNELMSHKDLIENNYPFTLCDIRPALKKIINEI
jgi:processive 1,2-diacylglycerol beta-glucosyltransferase